MLNHTFQDSDRKVFSYVTILTTVVSNQQMSTGTTKTERNQDFPLPGQLNAFLLLDFPSCDNIWGIL